MHIDEVTYRKACMPIYINCFTMWLLPGAPEHGAVKNCYINTTNPKKSFEQFSVVTIDAKNFHIS